MHTKITFVALAFGLPGPLGRLRRFFFRSTSRVKSLPVLRVPRFHARAVKARLFKQSAELSAIKAHIAHEGIVCDIGAYKGTYVYWLARWWPNSRVVAFEPLQKYAGCLADLCRRRKIHNVTVEAKAVSSSSERRPLYVPREHDQGASLVADEQTKAHCDVQWPTITSLDEYFCNGEQIALLKIDVEGAELDVFHGAARILRDQSPLLVFECENRHLRKRGKTVDDVFSHLILLGYRGRFVDGRKLRPLDEFKAAEHQREDGDFPWKARGYCNNFIFEKPR